MAAVPEPAPKRSRDSQPAHHTTLKEVAQREQGNGRAGRTPATVQAGTSPARRRPDMKARQVRD